ncbi:EAL domain-containing protein [Actinomadura madurae]|uniref:EAL domain-containing protein n=1 Tax=Actinomadura madurae TaxID=1993 RepID=UPI0020D21EE6|nr:EAL domain-containing protein [Actinomadura madurae]MCQ0011335.1 EAL domain-containing protein [Actinomadura madurae]
MRSSRPGRSSIPSSTSARAPSSPWRRTPRRPGRRCGPTPPPRTCAARSRRPAPPPGLGTPLPLQIGLRAETLAAGEDLLGELHRGLGRTGRRPQEIILCVTGGFPPARRPPLNAALSALRRTGYLVGLAGLGSAHAPLDLMADGASYLLKLDPELARAALTEPRRSALVAGLVELAHRLETHVLAPGMATPDQVMHLRAAGVRLVQGRPSRRRSGAPACRSASR